MTSGEIFNGIAAISQLGMAVVVSVGVYVAYKQSKAWRVEWGTKRRADAAETLLALAYEAKHRIAVTRVAFESYPEGEEDPQNAVLKAKWSRLKEADEVFENLRKSQVMVNALMPETKELIDRCISAIFEARQDVFIALSMANQTSNFDRPNREVDERIRRTIYGLGSQDELAASMSEAIEGLETALFPRIRAEELH